MLAMLLRGRNIQCDIADNGLEALNMVKSNGGNYDLVFMDFTMPVMVRAGMIVIVIVVVMLVVMLVVMWLWLWLWLWRR